MEFAVTQRLHTSVNPPSNGFTIRVSNFLSSPQPRRSRIRESPAGPVLVRQGFRACSGNPESMLLSGRATMTGKDLDLLR